MRNMARRLHIEDQDGVMRYVEFLRTEAALGVAPPIDLNKLYDRFQMPVPTRDQLDQAGILLDAETGLIVISEDDPKTRQRFSEAHEIIEMLIAALPKGKGWHSRRNGIFDPRAKENLCNTGAAELLMPKSSFMPRVRSIGVSYQSGRRLAREYDVSITAALVQMVRVGPGRHSVVLWRMKNKPTEMNNKVAATQLTLFGENIADMPKKKLRVEWSFKSSNAYHIPMDKSVPDDCPITAAWQNHVFTDSECMLDLGNGRSLIRCENNPLERDGETMVLSLIHLSGDSDCNAHTLDSA